MPPPPSPCAPALATVPEKETFVHTLFDRISPRYDLFNRLASLGLDQRWRRDAIAAARLRPGMRVLDLGSGTGDLALVAAAAVSPAGLVAAVDLSLSMLRLAARKGGRVPAGSRIRCINGRAERLPLPDRSMDAVVSGFVMRNVSDVTRTLAESRRVLRPAGRLVILEFSRPRGVLLPWGHRLWLTVGVPVLGWLATGARWPFAYLRQSIVEGLTPAAFVARMQAVGFTDVTATALLGGAVMIYGGARG